MRIVHISTNPVFKLGSTIEKDFFVANWRHKITATVGFDTASFNLVASKIDLEEMFFEGCGRRVTRYTPDGSGVVWDGYISEMILNEPGLQIRINLREMVNGIIVRYTPTDPTTNPPTYGTEWWAGPVNDVISQNKYGIKQKLFVPPANKLTVVDAEQFANTLLTHYRMPIRSSAISSGEGKPSLQVMCEGYAHTLDWHTYNQYTLSGTDNASTIMSTIAGNAQGFIPSQDFDTNTTQVQKYFLNFDTVYYLVQLIASFGDASFNRWLAYVLEDRVLHYKPASTTVDYFRRIEDTRQEIRDASGRVVPYWEVRPNHWIRTADIFPHALTPASLKDDFRTMFIESVEWAEPDRLTMSGSPGDNLQVIMARMAAQGDRML